MVIFLSGMITCFSGVFDTLLAVLSNFTSSSMMSCPQLLNLESWYTALVCYYVSIKCNVMNNEVEDGNARLGLIYLGSYPVRCIVGTSDSRVD